MDLEADFDEQNGWERYTVDDTQDMAAESSDSDSEVVTVVTAAPVALANNLQIKRRRSRTTVQAAA
jgi:hypothetical protein